MPLNTEELPLAYDESLITSIAKHIIDIIGHLKQVETENALLKSRSDSRNTKTDFNNATPLKTEISASEPASNAIKLFSLLLIGSDTFNEEVIVFINKYVSSIDEQLDITSLTLEQFLVMPFNKRFDLGCLITTDISLTPIEYKASEVNDRISVTDQADRFENKATDHSGMKKSKLIAIRLRDLFAHQSLIFTSLKHSQLDFNNLGFTLVPLSTSKSDTDTDTDTGTETDTVDLNEYQDLMTQLGCWQFNLYDYKRLPEWLNSRFWANPENYNKFRW